MLTQKFRAATKMHGEYCPAKNELRVRRGRRVYRVTCEECTIRFKVSSFPDVIFDLAPDATDRELSRSIGTIIDWRENERRRASG